MICVGPSASAVYVPPTLTRAASTNYNQNSGVLNGTIATTGNRAITSVEFQWSTSSTFASGNSEWTAASTNTTISQGVSNTARTVTATGLIENTSTGTPYYVRFRATNASGFVVTTDISNSGATGSFTTYKKNTPTFASSGTWTNPVPTSGTSGLAITSGTATVWAGGAGGYYGGGGGGGGARTVSTVTVGSTVTVTIGGGGAGGGFGGGSGNGSNSSFGSVSATGGYGTINENGGASGNGNNGGTGRGTSIFSGGGGGGVGGVGGNGANSYCGGGAGGAAISGKGGGGGGWGENSDTTPCIASPSSAGAANSAYGGAAGAAGGSGYVTFEYWGP